MAGQVEGDDAMTGLDERFDEHSKVCAAAAPAVHEVDRGPIAPGLPHDPVSGPVRLQGLAGRDAGRHAQAQLHGGRGAPQLDGPPRPTAGAKRSSSPNARRTLGAIGGSTPEPASSREARSRQPSPFPLIVPRARSYLRVISGAEAGFPVVLALGVPRSGISVLRAYLSIPSKNTRSRARARVSRADTGTPTPNRERLT